jgi:nucleotide-binding universal stress UspA family protein
MLEMRNLVKTAVSIAQRLDASLRLVHVCETSPIDDITGIPWQPAYRWQKRWLESVFFEYRKEQMAEAEKQLQSFALASGVPEDVEINAIAAAYPYQGILADAVASNAALILIGAGTKTSDYMTKGFATPLAVMADATVPVMVVGSKCHTDFSKPTLKVLLADDLREQTAEGVQKGLDWASRFGAAEILHLHVTKTHEFKDMLNKCLPFLRRDTEGETMATQSVHDFETGVLQRLKDRTMDFNEGKVDADKLVKHQICEGKDQSLEIDRAAESFGADILMFGRFHKTHRRPFMVGRTTYEALLTEKRAVMVFP